MSGRPEKAERRQRVAARWTAAAFGVSALAAVAFAAVYVSGGQTQAAGAALAVAFGGLAAGLTIWARRLLPTGGYVEEHPPPGPPRSSRRRSRRRRASADPDRPAPRRALLSMLGLAVGAIGAAALFPLRSLLPFGPGGPTRALRHTPWRGGARLVTADGSPVRPADVTAESILTVFPEGHVRAGDAPAFAVRLDPARFTVGPPGGHVDGLVVYSLLCTHAGCPVALYEQGDARVLCPCHQSAFDLLAAARPIAGPAARRLPGLPVIVDGAGYLRATGDFTASPGPGYWSRR